MTERDSLLLATALHAALFAALSLQLAGRMPDMLAEPDVTPIEFVELSPAPTVTELPRPSIEAAPRESEQPTPAPPEPAPQVADAVPEEPVAKAPPAPEKTRPAPPPQKKAAEKPAFDAGALAGLIDKSKAEAPVRATKSSDFAKSIEKSIPKNAQLSAIQTATLEQAIRAQIAPCWNPPLGGADVTGMTVLLRIRLNRDGAIAAPPEFVSQTGATAGNQAYARAFTETAKRAILRCAPLKLPDDLYAYWREFELNFDPRLMT